MTAQTDHPGSSESNAMSQVVPRPVPAALGCVFVLAASALGQPVTPYFRVRPDAPLSGSRAAATTGGFYGGVNWGHYTAPFLPWSPYTFSRDPNSAFLSGTADILGASGDLAVRQQQARLIGQQVEAARMANRRRAWEQWEWEQQRTPTLEDVREQERALALRRSRNDPPEPEILNGTALNTLLQHLAAQQGQGMIGPPVPLDQDMLRQINVFVAGSRSANSLGVMFQVDNLHWPMALREDFFDDERKEVTKLLQQLAVEAASNNVDFNKIRRLREILNNMLNGLRQRRDDVTIMQEIEARRFIREVQEAANTLQSPNVANFFNGKWSARGDTVTELVGHMSRQGLRFAAAGSGNEPAYIALHRAMADYDLALSRASLRANPGFQP
jgi:hypothetical protein